MHTDDAGTMARGGQKVEFTWAKNSSDIGRSAAYGFSPVEQLEIGLLNGRSAGGTSTGVTALGFKWVPIQAAQGWSLGLSLGRSLENGQPVGQNSRALQASTTLTILASYRMPQGHILHINLGSQASRIQQASTQQGQWSVGYELPLADRLQGTLETFGQAHHSASQALGMRYQLAEGLKISGAWGRSEGISFSQFGLAWEF